MANTEEAATTEALDVTGMIPTDIDQAGQLWTQVQDVVAGLVVAPGDEYFLSTDAVVVTLRGSAAPDVAQIRSRAGLGEVHGAGPLAAVHFFQVNPLLLSLP